MTEQQRQFVPEIFQSLGSAWQGALVSAGLSAGLFDALSSDQAITLDQMAEEKAFDRDKLNMWFYYFESMGFLSRSSDGYRLTDKGSLLKPGPETKELAGLLQLTQYYMQAAMEAPETFRKGKSLDKLTEGKISRDYQPKVSDTFSHALTEHLHRIGVLQGETLLDIGCGNGSMLRQVHKEMPGIKLTGVDKNLFAIEKGRKQNRNEGVHEQIKLLVGDIREDIDEFPKLSYDWVTAINIFHFIPEGDRISLIDHMLRIARKGVIMTEVMVETTPLSHGANPLMGLLWNDFSGFFRKSEMDELNAAIRKKHPNWKMELKSIMQGNSHLLIMTRPF